MECGGSEWWCHALQFVFGHSAEFGSLSDFMPWLTEKLRNNIQGLAGLLGVSFGFYRWWRSNERNMHRNLRRYLERNDRRLDTAQNYILNALEKPDLGHNQTNSLFATPELRKVLARAQWEKIGANAKLEEQIASELNAAIATLENHISVAHKTLGSYRKQLAGAHLLRGAISSTIAAEAWTSKSRVRHDDDALQSFRNARQVPGFETSLISLQFEAHQLRKLGHIASASALYLEVERAASKIEDSKERAFAIANAKRWRAAIQQSQTLAAFRANNTGPQGSLVARQLMARTSKNSAPGALDLRRPFGPFESWDAIDQGDFHYLTAYLNHKLGFTRLERRQLDRAELNYKLALRYCGSAGWLFSRRLWKLRSTARRGVERVALASKHCQYQEKWLVPPPYPIDS